MKTLTRRAAASGLAALLLSGAALAQTATPAAGAWKPDRPIKIITSSGAGGSLDVAARMFADLASSSLGQPIIVEAKPGASGMIATQFVARSPADGYTILFINGAIVQNEILQTNRPYKLSELQPLAMISKMPIVFAENASVKANTLGEYVKLARANPKDFAWASYGRGSSGHILGATLDRAANLDVTHVPYNGEGPVVTAVLGNTVSAGWGSPGIYGKLEQAGKIKILAITSKHPAVPQAPTFAEAGFPQISMEGFLSAFVPAGTPQPVVDRLWAEMQRAIADPRMRDALINTGGRAEALGPKDFGEFLKTDIRNWTAAVKENNITLE